MTPIKLFASHKKYAVILLVVMACVFAVKYLHFSVPSRLRNELKKYLIVADRLPENRADALYILGGSTQSTYRHIQRASQLYKKGKTDRVLIFDSKAKCGYDPLLKRNLTRNEWVIKMFSQRGVPPSVISIVPVNEGFFGTLSEARGLTIYLEHCTCKSAILVSSPCHTRRIAMAFGHYFNSCDIRMYIAGSNDPFAFSEMVLEMVKIAVYRAYLVTGRI